MFCEGPWLLRRRREFWKQRQAANRRLGNRRGYDEAKARDGKFFLENYINSTTYYE
jgi:hypothetical protein